MRGARYRSPPWVQVRADEDVPAAVTHRSREVLRNVDSMIAARALYSRLDVPVTLVYGDHDWSRSAEREANVALLRGARSIVLPETGHLAALEQPERVAEILLDAR
jgi:pimeloyl-ACP methyl ester carboxylesterase